MSLLTRLFLLVLLAVLPAVAIEAYSVVELRHVRETQVHQEALRLTRLANAEMDRIAEGTRQLLVAFGGRTAISEQDWLSCNHGASQLLPRLTGYVNIGVVTTGGDIVCSALPKARGKNIAASPSFRHAVAADAFTIGTYEVSAVSGAKILHFAEPLRNSFGDKIGVVFASLDLDWLARQFADRFAGPDVTLAIADRNGTIMLRLPEPEKWVGQKLGDKYGPMLTAAAEGTVEITGIDGVLRIIGYSPVASEPHGLYVGVGLTKAAVFADIDRATLRGAVLVALCLCLALIAAWAGGTVFLRRPIAVLLRAAERWRGGDYAARSGLIGGSSEIGRLGHAFDEMAITLDEREHERQRAEEQLRRFNETLEQRVAERTAELVDANRRLGIESDERARAEAALLHSQRIESIGQLTGGVAHDFNNLLTAVLGNIELAERRVGDERVKKLLGGALRAAERGARLTQQLLAFSRRQHLQPRPVDINELVRGMGDMLSRSIGATVSIDQRLAPDLGPAMTDPNQIELVILNLAINARDAMPLGGRLLIETGNSASDDPHRPADLATGDYVAITVSDTGTGMSEEVLARALEPFFTTKEPGKGSGLGLSMVYGVAKQSGGGIALTSRIGQGTTVRVYLPRAASAGVARDAERSAGALDPGALAGKSVLLIDDDPDVRQVTATMLADLRCRVVEAESGSAGLAALDRESAMDIAMIDFAMPGMNGIEVAEAIWDRRPSLPVVIVTGYAEGDLAAGRRDGLLVLKKPFQRADLIEMLLAALRPNRNGKVVRLHAKPRG